MHGDTKVGLAMTILLVGIAAALWFPRTPVDGNAVSPLADTRAIDAAIEQLPVRAYRVDVQPRVQAESSREPSVAQAVASKKPTSSSAELLRERGTAELPPTSAPAAIPGSPRNSRMGDDVSNAWSEADDLSAHEAVTHTVREGDTLSGLAGKYLGSVGKYGEIFEANRDQLQSPDDLRLGMKLRIPSRGR